MDKNSKSLDYKKLADKAQAAALATNDVSSKALFLKLAALWQSLARSTKSLIYAAASFGALCCLTPEPDCFFMDNCPCCIEGARATARLDV